MSVSVVGLGRRGRTPAARRRLTPLPPEGGQDGDRAQAVCWSGRHGPEGDAGQRGVGGAGGDLRVEPGGQTGRVAPGVVGPGRQEGVGAGGEEGDGGAEAPAVVGVTVGRGAAELFRGGVAGRAGDAVLRLPYGASVLQVDDTDLPGDTPGPPAMALVGHQDVVGIEVADHDPGGVEGGHGLGQGGGQAQGLVGRQRHHGSGSVALHHVAQRRGVDVLLDQEDVACVLEEVDQPGSPVDAFDQGEHVGFVAHPGPGVAPTLVADVGPAFLDDDELAGGRVLSEVGAALVGVAQRTLDAVAVVKDHRAAGPGGSAVRRGGRRGSRLEGVGQPRRRPVGGGALVGQRCAVGPLDEMDDDAVGVDGRGSREPAVAVVDETAGPVRPVGEDDRAGKALGGQVAGLGQADGLVVVGRVDGEELPAGGPIGVGGVEEPDDRVVGRELEGDALGHQDGDGGAQHIGGRRFSRGDVQLPSLLRGTGPGRGGESPRSLDREAPLGPGRHHDGASGDGEVAEYRRSCVEGGDFHG